MDVMFCVGDYVNWDVLQKKIKVYKNFPSATLPQVGSRIVPDETLKKAIDNYRSHNEEYPLDFVRRIDVTPLGPVVIIGHDPKKICVNIFLLGTTSYTTAVFDRLPQRGDVIREEGLTSDYLYVDHVRFRSGYNCTVYVTKEKPIVDRTSLCTSSSEPIKVEVVNTVNTHALVVNEAPLEITPAGDNAMEVWIAGQDRNKPLAVKIDNNPLY